MRTRLISHRPHDQRTLLVYYSVTEKAVRMPI